MNYRFEDPGLTLLVVMDGHFFAWVYVPHGQFNIVYLHMLGNVGLWGERLVEGVLHVALFGRLSYTLTIVDRLQG